VSGRFAAGQRPSFVGPRGTIMPSQRPPAGRTTEAGLPYRYVTTTPRTVLTASNPAPATISIRATVSYGCRPFCSTLPGCPSVCIPPNPLRHARTASRSPEMGSGRKAPNGAGRRPARRYNAALTICFSGPLRPSFHGRMEFSVGTAPFPSAPMPDYLSGSQRPTSLSKQGEGNFSLNRL